MKDQARWRVQEWASEVAHEAVDETARTGTRVKPLLLMKVPGVTDPGRWLAVVRLEDLEL